MQRGPSTASITCRSVNSSAGFASEIPPGVATAFVLLGSNFIVSVIKPIIPKSVRIPVYIVVIATFVTIVDLALKAYLYDLSRNLGLFVPLIVVNCLILGRSEAYASRNPVLRSVVDGFGMGVGFTFALFLLGAVREVIGSGAIFGYEILGGAYNDVLVMILPPGAFLATGVLLGLFNFIDSKRGA